MIASMALNSSPRIRTVATRSAGVSASRAPKRHAQPSFPGGHQLGAGHGLRRFELGVAVPARLLAVRGEEVGPARQHVPAQVLHDDGDAVRFRVQRHVQVPIVPELGDRLLGPHLDPIQLLRDDVQEMRTETARVLRHGHPSPVVCPPILHAPPAETPASCQDRNACRSTSVSSSSASAIGFPLVLLARCVSATTAGRSAATMP